MADRDVTLLAIVTDLFAEAQRREPTGIGLELDCSYICRVSTGVVVAFLVAVVVVIVVIVVFFNQAPCPGA